MAVTTHYLHSHSEGLQSNEAGHSSKPNSVKNAKQRSKLPVFTFSSRTGEVEKKKKDKTNNKKKKTLQANTFIRSPSVNLGCGIGSEQSLTSREPVLTVHSTPSLVHFATRS